MLDVSYVLLCGSAVGGYESPDSADASVGGIRLCFACLSCVAATELCLMLDWVLASNCSFLVLCWFGVESARIVTLCESWNGHTVIVE